LEVTVGTLALLRRDIEASARDARAASEPRRRLRRVVHRIDLLVAECERAHLEQQSMVTEKLAIEAESVYREAAEILPQGLGDAEVPDHIVDLMEALWTLQESAFDTLSPWRRSLPRDEGARPER
jgi:hypothetical protein